MRVALVAVLLGGVAVAAPADSSEPAAKVPPPAVKVPPMTGAKAPPAPAVKTPPPPVWIGVFDPKLPAHPPWDNAKLTPVPHGGAVRVLTPGNGAAASGDVVIVHPLLGKTAAGKVDKGAVALADFAFDQRDGDDGVIVLPASTTVAVVTPSRSEVAAITAMLVRTEALSGVRRALAGIELGAIDIDGDGKADLVATYGCTAWFDGSCQSKGQFFLARRGARWTIID